MTFVAHGAFGEVYFAYDRVNKRAAAIKIFNNKKELDTTYVRNEIKAMQSLVHPNIVEYYGSYLWKNVVWTAMEFCTSGNLREAILQNQMDESVIAYVAREVSSLSPSLL